MFGEEVSQLLDAFIERNTRIDILLQVSVDPVDHFDGEINFEIAAGGIGADVDQVLGLAVDRQRFFQEPGLTLVFG